MCMISMQGNAGSKVIRLKRRPSDVLGEMSNGTKVGES